MLHLCTCPGDVKSAITKGGGKPADSGSVMFNFMRQGQVLVSGADEDELFEAAIEAGADDVQPVFDEEGQPTNDFKVRDMHSFGWQQSFWCRLSVSASWDESSS
jgi:transcriptional/translational regulatory protein YebC/TACO1